MFWTERALPLFVALLGYVIYFKCLGRLEGHLQRWITPERAVEVVFWLGRIFMASASIAGMLTGIFCSTGLMLVILFHGVPLREVLVAVPIGCTAFALQSVIERVSEGCEEHEEQAQIDALFASLRD